MVLNFCFVRAGVLALRLVFPLQPLSLLIALSPLLALFPQLVALLNLGLLLHDVIFLKGWVIFSCFSILISIFKVKGGETGEWTRLVLEWVVVGDNLYMWDSSYSLPLTLNNICFQY